MEKTVYQVRAVDVFGNQRVVHSYETEYQAKQAILMMQKRSGRIRYIYLTVQNDPSSHWGIKNPS